MHIIFYPKQQGKHVLSGTSDQNVDVNTDQRFSISKAQYYLSRRKHTLTYGWGTHSGPGIVRHIISLEVFVRLKDASFRVPRARFEAQLQCLLAG